MRVGVLQILRTTHKFTHTPGPNTGRTPRRRRTRRRGRTAPKQASQKGHTDDVASPQPPRTARARHRDRAKTRTPAAHSGVRGDGRDGGVHLVAHEVCELRQFLSPHV